MISPEQRAASRYPAIQAGRHHAEAFCLMTYEDEVNGRTERLWNSRDGVTPFVITSRWGNSARHVGRDDYQPGHVPNVGDRVFVDLTPERARVLAEAYADKLDERTDEYNLTRHLEERGMTREEFVTSAVEDSLSQGKPFDPEERAALEAKLAAEGYTAGPPDVVEVTAEMRSAFAVRSVELVEADPICRQRREAAGEQEERERRMRRLVLEGQLATLQRELRTLDVDGDAGDADPAADLYRRLVRPGSPGAPRLVSEPFREGQEVTVGQTPFVVHKVQRRGLVLRYPRFS